MRFTDPSGLANADPSSGGVFWGSPGGPGSEAGSGSGPGPSPIEVIGEAASNAWSGWYQFVHGIDDSMQRARDLVKPVDTSWKKHCVTAECIVGFPPRIDVRTNTQIQEAGCQMICGWLWPGPIVPTRKVELLTWTASQTTSYFGCKWICKDGNCFNWY